MDTFTVLCIKETLLCSLFMVPIMITIAWVIAVVVTDAHYNVQRRWRTWALYIALTVFVVYAYGGLILDTINHYESEVDALCKSGLIK